MRISFEDTRYRPFFSFFIVAVPCLLLVAPAYLCVCERYGRWPAAEDELLHLGEGYASLLRGRRPGPRFAAALRSMLVKFFFLPVMIVFWVENTGSFGTAIGAMLSQPHGSVRGAALVGRLFEVTQQGIILLDLSLATIGYAAATRLLDTHVRWAEPTLAGWAVALACYPPFSVRITEQCLRYVDQQTMWSSTLGGYPVLFGVCAGAILVLLGAYTLATVMFGLRFSNLTHRGILCRGPYALVRHPAYAAKNLAWWMISLPFLRSPGDCIRLALWNVIYVLRALTEERNLRCDPMYREYMRRVRWRFIPGLM